MSYILDALKRAESERSRGAIPNIHAQPGLAGDGEASDPVAGTRGMLLIAVAVLVLAAAAWWWLTRDDSAPPTVLADAIPPIPSPVAPAATPPKSAVTARLPASMAVPEPTAPAKGHPLPWAAQKADLPQTPPSTRQTNAVAGSSATAGTRAAEPAVTEPTPTAAAAASASERVYTLKELPENIRSSLPVLIVGGSTYSENAASRMLIVNGNLFHEGDKLTSEVTLQQIKLRAAVLSFRGYRYSISY